ncbi:hypothetical protein JRQ81_013774 [Phrynocephalus forsythii]|uniref:Interleukin-6 n=1 Tax=Phrynocephalus forsythii TaxID=171643 RepID=A0A9Q0Y332_9SAUR|nr:hypothetical protein JRQ81_013774 [Phrynocephalus forsythii]
MESSRLFALLGAASLLLLLGVKGQEEAELQPRALDLYSTVEDTSHEKELIEALQEVLEKLKSKRLPLYEKKYGQVPLVSTPIKLRITTKLELFDLLKQNTEWKIEQMENMHVKELLYFLIPILEKMS